MTNVARFPKDKAKQPAKGATLACPAHLDGLARAEWRRIVADPEARKLFGPANRATLEAYCVTYARWRDAEEHLAKHGPIVPTPRTNVPMHSPMMTVAAKERAALVALAAELGLTPASRSKVRAHEAGGDGNGWEGLLK